MNEIWIQVIMAVGGIFGGGLALLKYSIAARQKEREELFNLFQEMHDNSQKLFQLTQEHIITIYGQKNSQIERLGVTFTNTVEEANKQTELTRERLTQAIQGNTAAIGELRELVRNNTRVVSEGTQINKEALTMAKEINK